LQYYRNISQFQAHMSCEISTVDATYLVGCASASNIRSRNFVIFIKQLPRCTCNNCVCCAGATTRTGRTCDGHWGRDTLGADRAIRALAVGPRDKDLMGPTGKVRASTTMRQVGPTLVVSECCGPRTYSAPRLCLEF
jgi:hypothetical protein